MLKKISFDEVKKMYPKANFEVLKSLLRDGNGYVCGGVFKDIFLGKHPKDYDVFFRDGGDRGKYERFLRDEGYKLSYFSDYSSTYKKGNTVVQVVDYRYGRIKKILESFDFSVCLCGAYKDKKKGIVFVIDTTFFEDLENMLVCVCGDDLVAPVHTLQRAFRYVEEYGFTIDKDSIAAICYCIRDMDEEDFEECFYE